jgi:hypothetical protein
MAAGNAFTLVRRAIPEVDTESIARETSVPEETIAVDSIEDLLRRAQELHGYRAPINQRITLIRDTLANRLSPVYTDDNQLSMFDAADGYAVRDPEDQQRIVVSHPRIGIKFRMKRTRTTKYKEIRRSIADEIARRESLRGDLSQLSHSQFSEVDREIRQTHQTYIDALNWVQELFDNRVAYRTDKDFVGGAADDKESLCS